MRYLPTLAALAALALLLLGVLALTGAHSDVLDQVVLILSAAAAGQAIPSDRAAGVRP